jgi:hypothetical protein
MKQITEIPGNQAIYKQSISINNNDKKVQNNSRSNCNSRVCYNEERSEPDGDRYENCRHIHNRYDDTGDDVVVVGAVGNGFCTITTMVSKHIGTPLMPQPTSCFEHTSKN